MQVISFRESNNLSLRFILCVRIMTIKIAMQWSVIIYMHLFNFGGYALLW